MFSRIISLLFSIGAFPLTHFSSGINKCLVVQVYFESNDRKAAFKDTAPCQWAGAGRTHPAPPRSVISVSCRSQSAPPISGSPAHRRTERVSAQ